MGNLLSSDVGYTSTTITDASNLHTILDAMIRQESYTKNALQDAIEDLIADDAISMDDLIGEYAERKYSHSKARGIIRGTSGITSAISSSIFIWMIMRSHDRLSTTQHRLLLGLCISDIIFSLSNATFNAAAPSENDYEVWNARGDQASCTVQGFLAVLGTGSALFYNASLNLYFLAVVKYKKSDEFIRAKIEPYLHGVPIVLALSASIYRVVKKHYNDDGSGNCILPINAQPHCHGYIIGEIREGFEIPCWRGIDGAFTAGISTMVGMFIPILIIIVSLGMIYSAVRTQGKKLARYGVGALRSTNLQQQSVKTSTSQSSGIRDRLSTSLTALSNSLKAGKWSCRNTRKPVTRSNSLQSQSRAVMHRAFGYTFAWFSSYGFYLIGAITAIATGSFPLVLSYLSAIFGPLQGLFNLLIFMYPKIVAAKKSKKRGGREETVSWCDAFSIAFWSRGKGGNNQGTSRSNLRRESRNRCQKKKTKNEDTASDNVSSPMFGRIKKKKKTTRADTTQEGEKCEIQVSDNLNPHKTKAKHSAASTAIYAPNISPSLMETTVTRAMNASANDMKKEDFEEHVNVGNGQSDALEYSDEDSISNQDEQEEMEKNEEENVDIVPVVADSPFVADVKEEEEISMEN